MSAITAAQSIRRPNPPLEYSKTAIREHLQLHATNGPAYVQIQATKALARMIGLYDDAKSGINHTVDQAKERARDGALSISQRCRRTDERHDQGNPRGNRGLHPLQGFGRRRRRRGLQGAGR